MTDLADRLATLSGERSNRQAAAQHRRRLYDAAVDAFRSAAAQRPLVLVLEDLHWAGSTALQLLSYLVEQTAEARSCCSPPTGRPTPERSVALEQAIAPLYRLDGVRRIDLVGLDAEEISQYLVREGGLPPGRARAWAAGPPRADRRQPVLPA